MSSEPPFDQSLWHILQGFGAALLSALIGRLMWHVGQVRKGTRAFWSLELLWELPLAMGMAIIGKGLAEYIGLSGNAEAALIAALAYLGPRGTEALLAGWLARRK